MQHVIVFMIIFIISVVISFLWVRGINNMNKHHPKYKGEDFLNWDDNKTHTENEP